MLCSCRFEGVRGFYKGITLNLLVKLIDSHLFHNPHSTNYVLNPIYLKSIHLSFCDLLIVKTTHKLLHLIRKITHVPQARQRGGQYLSQTKIVEDSLI